MSDWRWGRAGERLTDAERDRRRRARKLDRLNTRERQARYEQEACRAWAEGRLVPAAMTLAMDRKGLYGPEVDEACGAREPDVDRWEAGELYPTWEQVKLLAELCGVQPRFFAVAPNLICPESTSLRFHIPRCSAYPCCEPPVLRFTPEALTARLGSGWRSS